MTKTRTRDTDRVFKALADPTRRDILSLLKEHRLAVGAIAQHFDMSRPAISKHLRILRDANLVVDEAQGAASICSINTEPLQSIDEWLETYRGFWRRSLGRLKEHVENTK